MEIKDLVLLMLIPILLISLVIYTNKFPSITGVASFEEQKSKIIGTYTTNPSFKIKVNYNLNEYEGIRQTLEKIVNECMNSPDIEKCFKDKSNELRWNCQEDEESILFDFVDRFNECLNLKEDNIVCRFSFDERNVEDKILNIRLTTEEGRIRADLLEGSLENNPIINPENTLPADIKLIETAHINQEDIIYVDDWEERETQRIKADTIIIELKYESGKPKIINAFIELKDKSRIELSSTILLYKIKNEIKFIYRQIESSFKAPGVHTMIDLPKIIAHKFCVKTNNKIYAYDKSDNKVAPRDIVYRFAVTYPKFIAPPKPVQNLKVYDAKKAENGVILTWVISKDEEQNIKSFAIYYSQSGFIDKKTNDIKNGIYKAVKRIEIDNKPIEIYDIDLNECEFSPIGERCKYKISATKKEQKQLAQFDENTLYYSEIKNMYIYLLRDKSNIIDDQKNRLAVTALNHEGLEMDNNQNYKFIENQNYKIFTPEDDLAPDSSQIKLIGERLYDQKSKRVTFIFGDVPTNNLDGTSINNDLKNCRIYYIKNFDQDKFMDSKINNQQLLTEVNCKELGRPFAVDLSKTNPQTGDIYFFVIVTSDTSDNPKENEFTFKELGTISQKFVIP